MTTQPINRDRKLNLILEDLLFFGAVSLKLLVLPCIMAPGLSFANDSSSPRQVTIGSTNAQINAALTLCGKYSEGCELDWYSDEAERTITLRPYRLDLKEVSVSDFEKYVQSNNVTTEVEKRRSSAVTDENDPLVGYYADDVFWYNGYAVNNPKYPVVHVTFNDASGYCASIGKRLPTEAEWEFAARSGSVANIFPWGNNWEDASAYRGVALPQRIPTPVGSFQPNRDGFYDLSGNVAEWTVSDIATDEKAIVKGGSRFSTNVANLRAAVRRLEDKEYSGDDVGFRCAETLDQWPGSSQPLSLAINQHTQPTTNQSPDNTQTSILTEAPQSESSQPEDTNSQSITLSQRPATTTMNKPTVEDRKNNAVNELLQRVKVMRKVREKKQQKFADYMTNSLPEAMSYLFNN